LFLKKEILIDLKVLISRPGHFDLQRFKFTFFFNKVTGEIIKDLNADDLE